jgi:hypothetical protein
VGLWYVEAWILLAELDSLTPVLLLDEADVFLEERSLTDLKRNSLVSGNQSYPPKTDNN